MSKKNKTIHIAGMTCVSCEKIITDELGQIEGIEQVTVCHKKKTAEIKHEKHIDYNQVIETVKKLGYDASTEPIQKTIKRTATPQQWLYSILIVLGLYLLYRLFDRFGVLSRFDFDMTNMTYGVPFLIGIVASMSTCLAVVGAVVVSFAAKYQSRGSFYEANVKPQILFHIGRIGTFFVLGGVLGMIGGVLELSTSFIGIFTVVIAIVLGWLGLNILGFVPSMSTLGVRMPKGTMNTWSKLKNSDHFLAPVILGGFTFFLPCGFTQSMQIFAMSTGSFLTGGVVLATFAVGTLPILFGLGVATSKFKNANTVAFQKVIGFVVIMFALYTLSSGFAMAGIDIGFLDKSETGEVVTQEDIQVVNMVIDYGGFSPNVFTLKKGVPVRWVINGDRASGCTNEIIVPEYGIRKAITKGDNIVEFTPEREGNVAFSCWMGMVRGRFNVVN